MKTYGLISNGDTKDLIADTLRLYVGQGKKVSWADLADATGDEEGTLRSYVRQDQRPLMPLDVFMRVFAVLPPAAFARVARHMGFAASLAEAVDETVGLRRTLAKAARFVADGNEYLEDGIISPSERAKLVASASDLGPEIQALAQP